MSRPEEDAGYPRAGAADGCGPPWGSCELNLEPEEEQPVLLGTEPSLQPQVSLLWLQCAFNLLRTLEDRVRALGFFFSSSFLYSVLHFQ